MVHVVIHTNLGLENQRICGTALKQGFERHELQAEISPDIHKQADLHVIQGPWYAFKEWIGQPNVLWLDRCFYGCAKTVLSIGWLNPDGSRNFGGCDKPVKGQPPELQERKEYRGTCIVFGDYNRDMSEEIQLARKKHQRVYFRPHPAEHKNDSPVIALRGPLENVLDFADVAIGHSSTALIEAELHGLLVESTDPNHVVHHDGDRDKWLRQLSWKQWHLDEIRAGKFWEHLNDNRIT